MGWIAITSLDQVVTVRADGALSFIASGATDNAVSTFAIVTGDDRIYIVQMAPDVDTSTLAKGAVITDGAIDEAQRALDVNPASDSGSSVATDGDVGELCLAIATDMNTTAIAHISERIRVLRVVTTNRAVHERQRTSLAFDTTTVATGVTDRSDSIGDVNADGAVDECQRTPVADSGSRI